MATKAKRPPLDAAERQRRYQARIRTGELKRFQFVLPLEVGIKAAYLTDALQCNQVELFSRLLLEEWVRQGSPVSAPTKKRPSKRGPRARR